MTKNVKEAIRWLLLAEEKAYEDARDTLLEILDDPTTVIPILTEFAEQGDPRAQFYLGTAYAQSSPPVRCFSHSLFPSTMHLASSFWLRFIVTIGPKNEGFLDAAISRAGPQRCDGRHGKFVYEWRRGEAKYGKKHSLVEECNQLRMCKIYVFPRPSVRDLLAIHCLYSRRTQGFHPTPICAGSTKDNMLTETTGRHSSTSSKQLICMQKLRTRYRSWVFY